MPNAHHTPASREVADKFARIFRAHDAIDRLLTQTNTTTGHYLGYILPAPVSHVVAQDIGRNEIVFHCVDCLDSIPAPDSLVEIAYSNGKATVTTPRNP